MTSILLLASPRSLRLAMVISMLMGIRAGRRRRAECRPGRVAEGGDAVFVPTMFTFLHSRRDRGATLRRKPPNWSNRLSRGRP